MRYISFLLFLGLLIGCQPGTYSVKSEVSVRGDQSHNRQQPNNRVPNKNVSNNNPTNNNPTNDNPSNNPTTSPSSGNSSAVIQADGTVQATGYGESKKQARDDALRSAVEQVAGVKIFSQTTVQDFVALKDVMISESFGMVTSYDIISDNQLDGGEWEVTLTANVSKDVGDRWDQISVILRQKGNPSIMFVFKENLDGNSINPPIGEYALAQKYKNMDFQVIDRTMFQETQALQKDLYSLDQNMDGITAVASQRGADLVMIGTVDGSFVRAEDFFGTKGFSYSYSVRAKIIRTDTSQIVASVGETFTTNPAQYSDAVFSQKSAGETGMKEVAEQKYIQRITADMVETWIRDVQQGTDMNIVISNVKFSQRKRILETLGDQKSFITSVDVKHYRNKRLELRVKSKLSTEELAEKLENIQGLPLDVVELKKNTLEVKYVGN